ncbi:ABC transporter permease [Actinomadura vinacea]|uniref:ABC transporter permease n=1 Tax=Actinomadura vinacea TaxID=115336 RepID=A0ABN3JMB8_9ACTN
MATTTTPGATAADAPPTTPRRSGRSLRKAARPILAAVVFIGLWQAICSGLKVPTYIVPSPLEVGRSLSENRSMLVSNTWPTAMESLLGFLAGNGVAILLAVLFVHWKPAEDALMPVAVFIRTIPIVAVAPVLVILLGTGYAPKIVIAALISFFPTLVNMVRGLSSVDKQAIELFRVLSASQAEIFWRLRVFASLPYLFSALKISATSCVIGAIVAEWIGAQKGLGFVIIQATYNFTTPLLYAAMIVASLMAVVFFGAIGLIERLVVTWNPEPAP